MKFYFRVVIQLLLLLLLFNRQDYITKFQPLLFPPSKLFWILPYLANGPEVSMGDSKVKIGSFLPLQYLYCKEQIAKQRTSNHLYSAFE